MRRTTISLPDDLADALDRESRRRAQPASAIAREALSAYLGVGRSGERRELPFVALGHSGRRNTARDMEELLQRAWASDARDR
ncbi:MAG: ribbon-helix-helix protein, CopG family [Solirubrobacterales bacterium]|nr:ribbon-helix-helix protein, CopG family [Solirubrobacterales bacterium]MBV8944346.1 ribbon-helix-helix protein, CopG family [Solirubrobacterales bacterium]MBV9367795.1 ribbon-helix-helix protein, CopG family [Solirubrobacterales bacterium]MBV9683181.1 ribbon-helix-helix protein, CopG family [Solirubrobacterales bacterium]MBV9810865.1 ribbon-helix-helix protein, CopG family [Solirubrobacterales bacterium]